LAHRGKWVIAAVGVLALVAAGCGDDDASSSTADPSQAPAVKVVASFYPLAELASRIGGDRVEVTNLTPPGAEPHDLELTTDQFDSILDADLVLYLGPDFQPAVADAADERSGGALDLTTAVALDKDDADGGHGADPHFWLDPTLLAAAADAVQAELTRVAPDDADTFAANADAYRAELTQLDADFQTALTGCARDEIVTAHAAFHYLAARYGLQQLAITGLSPESEPDPSRLDELADLVQRDGITTIFYETLVSPDIAETLARETGAATAVLNPIEGLTKNQIAAGDDYESAQRANLAALVAALGCPAG